jgi:acetyltransferase
MIQHSLFHPASIAVIGASENTSKPGGKVIWNLLQNGYAGRLYAINKNMLDLPGAEYYPDIVSAPRADLAILSIPAPGCVDAVRQLIEKGTLNFIVFSAGFGESRGEGKNLEAEMVSMIREAGGCLIGPNCIGIIHRDYKAVFTTPVPEYDPQGCELISSSGATAVFIMEAAVSTGLRFSNIYSVGNSAQTGPEEILEYLDEHFDENSPRVKLLYMEDIRNPFKLLKHASSLVRKGCRIAAIKSGYSEAGSRAASSHTGALASSDRVVRALFRKAGIVYCSSRDELITVACVFQSKLPDGDRVAIITHAGGSAVLLTDALTSGGMSVPSIPPEFSKDLASKLHPGSSVANPIDFLATGTADQLSEIIDFCDVYPGIDSMIVVFGSPGLFSSVRDVYQVIHRKMMVSRKPIYAVLPSLVNAQSEIEEFMSFGHVNFPDEVVLGQALPHVYFRPLPTFGMTHLAPMESATIRSLISQASDGYLDPQTTRELLTAAGISMAAFRICRSPESVLMAAEEIGVPVALKVVGPEHKTEVSGVALHLSHPDELHSEYERLMTIPGARAVLVQQMKSGEELYCGAVREGNFGHLVLCGLGGIFVEVLNDVSYGLAPLNEEEAIKMIRRLKGYQIIRGFRKRPGVDEDLFAEAIVKLASLVHLAPEIAEIDINPFLGNPTELVAVDARVRIEK